MSNFAFSQILNQLGRLVKTKVPIVIACSGGLDSQVLAYVASKSKAVGPIVCAYVHHGMRTSSEEEQDIDAIQSLDLPMVTLQTGNTAKLDEHTARKLRYGALAEYAHKHGYNKVATAHHADDQFETLLMSMCRGINGAKPMQQSRPISVDAPYRDITLIRPCLGLTKANLKEIAVARDIKWHEDITNEDVAFARNRIRKEVIPVLKALYPKCAEHSVLV